MNPMYRFVHYIAMLVGAASGRSVPLEMWEPKYADVITTSICWRLSVHLGSITRVNVNLRIIVIRLILVA